MQDSSKPSLCDKKHIPVAKSLCHLQSGSSELHTAVYMANYFSYFNKLKTCKVGVAFEDFILQDSSCLRNSRFATCMSTLEAESF